MKKRKIVALLLSVAMTGSLLAGCNSENGKDDGEKKVMNVSLNPEVEFVLDENDKVISVNALNEEGNLIISAEAFANVEGKTAEEAAKLFVEVSKDTGYLVSGTVSAGENELKISLSGDEESAKKLYNEVKDEVEEYLSKQEVQTTITQASAITEEELKTLLAECASYVDTAEMEYAELVETLAQSRKETADFYSQELKNAYYEAKAFAIEQAEIETLKAELGTIEQFAFNVVNDIYVGAVETIEKTRLELLVEVDSPYQVALKAFQEAKVEYLNYRQEVSIGNIQITVEANAEQLEAYKKAVESAEAALLSAAETANASLDTAKVAVKEAYDTVIQTLESLSVKASEHLEAIKTAQDTAKTEFSVEFKANTQYAEISVNAKASWNDMRAELEAGYQTAE